MLHPVLRQCLPPLLLIASVLPAAAAGKPEDAAIAGRLTAFAAAFNARDAAGACDLFTPDLVATTPLAPEVTRDALCRNFERLFSKTGLVVRYDVPDIREVIHAGDLAIVRVIWTLHAESGGERDTTQEGAIDIFRLDPDGIWSIMRMNAFGFRPNKVLD